MKIKINQERCVGCGRCAEMCPTIFKLNEEGKATVIDAKIEECEKEPTGEECAVVSDIVKKTADECVVEAIDIDMEIK
jgi:ferredoxin